MIKNYNEIKKGLSKSEIEESRKKYGSNTITEEKPKSILRKYFESFSDPIIRILLISLALNLVFVIRDGDWYESVGIALAVFISTFVSTISEYGSEAAFRKLKSEAFDTECRVIRNGQITNALASDLVFNDLIRLSAGEKVPADCIMVYGSISADQSALNGESKEIQKTAVSFPFSDSNIQWKLEDKHQLFKGSLITEGDGYAIIKRVGDNTFYGNMATEMQSETRESPLKLRLEKLARTLSRIGYAAAVIVALSDLICSVLIGGNISSLSLPLILQHTFHALTLGITIVVVSVPEGLPMMITVVLSSNMFKMMKDNVMVRKLVGIETAGSTDIIFTDKTGTITKGNTSVTSFILANGTEYTKVISMKPRLRRLIELSAVFNTGSSISQNEIIGGNSTDRAMLAFSNPRTLNPSDFIKSAYIPFDSMYKFSSASVTAKAGEKIIFVKGAPELIIDNCVSYIDQDGKELDMYDKKIIKDKISKLTEKASRIIALAISAHPIDKSGRFKELTLIGIASIKDEVRREASTAIKLLNSAGIQTVMITGDNKDTAQAVALECGIIKKQGEGVLTGDELKRMSDNDIKKALPSLRVISRALPSDKSRLVKLSQERGHVVGMTGDGINDAPALKKADIGFAMGSGTEVAKEAGDIVILDNNISSIAKAVLYGRTIFKNIRKFIVFQLTMNMCAVGVSIIGPFIGIDTPVTVMQMLWINIIMDTLAGLAFAGEPALKSYMKEAPKKRDEAVLDRKMIVQIASMGIYTLGMCIYFLVSSSVREQFRSSPDGIYFLTAFFALFVFSGIFNCFNARTYSVNIFSHLSKNITFLIILGSVCVIQIFIINSGLSVFRTVPLTLSEFKAVILMAVSVIPVNIAVKLILRFSKRRKK